jgi:hypothetical protein
MPPCTSPSTITKKKIYKNKIKKNDFLKKLSTEHLCTTQIDLEKTKALSRALMAHASNPSYSGSKTNCANSSQK